MVLLNVRRGIILPPVLMVPALLCKSAAMEPPMTKTLYWIRDDYCGDGLATCSEYYAECENVDGGYSCTCQEGYDGDRTSRLHHAFCSEDSARMGVPRTTSAITLMGTSTTLTARISFVMT